MTIAAAPIADWPVAFGLVDDEGGGTLPDPIGTDYPAGLPLMLRATKARSQPAAFRMAEPRRGFPYVQASGTDTPLFYECAWRFTQEQARVFQTWFQVNIQRGVLAFAMPVRTEFGMRTYTCRFLPDGLMDATEEGPLWYYKARIVAREPISGGGGGVGTLTLDGSWTLDGSQTLDGTRNS